ncbi:MAG: class F sortase [Dehalococcoidia bacterium]
MKLLRSFPIAVFLLGIATVAAAVACGGGEKQQVAADTPTATQPATGTPTTAATNTPSPSPTPSPTPYNGSIARFKFPRLKIDAPIEELAVNARNELDTPKAENTAVGWYHIYDKPGRTNPDNGAGWVQIAKKDAPPARGNAVFSAHIYYHNVPAPFVNLAKSVVGDEVIIQMEDGREYKYRVIAKDRYHRDKIDMGAIIWPKTKPDDKEWITLITCGGALDETGQEYIDRDVVVAEAVE